MSVISESEFNEAWYLGLTTGEQLPVFSRHKDEQHTHVEGAAFTLSKSAQRPLWNGIQCHQGLSRSDPRTCLLLRRFDFSRKTGEAGGLISTRNWGGTREGSQEGKRHPFPLPLLPCALTTLAARKASGNEAVQGQILHLLHPTLQQMTKRSSWRMVLYSSSKVYDSIRQVKIRDLNANISPENIGATNWATWTSTESSSEKPRESLQLDERKGNLGVCENRVYLCSVLFLPKYSAA